MKRVVIATVAALLISPAFAATIQVTPEIQTQFKQYVIKQKVKPVTMQEKVVVGTALPATVMLEPVPDVIVQTNPDFKTYEYAYVGNENVLVEPKTRKVIQVIE
jgi:hypothetical protein